MKKISHDPHYIKLKLNILKENNEILMSNYLAAWPGMNRTG
jgi:hypothetical protein